MLHNTLRCFKDPLCLLCCSSFYAWIRAWIIPHNYRGFVHPQLFMYFTKVVEIPFDLPKILSSLLLLKFLFACIMVNPIFLAISVDIPCHYHSSPLIQYVANACNPQSDPSIHPPGSDVTPNMNLFLSNQTLIDCRYVSIQINYILIRASASYLLIWKS